MCELYWHGNAGNAFPPAPEWMSRELVDHLLWAYNGGLNDDDDARTYVYILSLAELDFSHPVVVDDAQSLLWWSSARVCC